MNTVDWIRTVGELDLYLIVFDVWLNLYDHIMFLKIYTFVLSFDMGSFILLMFLHCSFTHFMFFH